MSLEKTQLERVYESLISNGILRQDQINFVDTIVDAFTEKEHGSLRNTVIEAWTGFGKTRSILLASILTSHINSSNINTQRNKIFITCSSKEQQNNYLSELKKIKDKIEKLLNIKIEVLGSYKCLLEENFKDEQPDSKVIVKILFLKGKSNYVLKKKLNKFIEKIDDTLAEKLVELFNRAYGDLEVARLIDKEGIIDKVSEIDKIENLLASVYTDIRTLSNSEYLIQLRNLAAESDIIITNHFLIMRYLNLLYSRSRQNGKNGDEKRNGFSALGDKEDITLDRANLLRQLDFARSPNRTNNRGRVHFEEIINYGDFVIFDEAHNLMHVYLQTSSRSRTLRKSIIVFNDLIDILRQHTKKKDLTFENKEIQSLFDDLKTKVDNLKALVDQIRNEREEILKESKEKIELENLAILIFVSEDHLKLIYNAVEQNINCLEGIENLISKLNTLEAVKEDEDLLDKLDFLKKEIAEDKNFFHTAKRNIEAILKDKKRSFEEDESKISFSRILIDFSEEYHYPSLLFACNIRTYSQKALFKHMVYTSATLVANNNPKLIEKIEKAKFKKYELRNIYEELRIYPLKSLGIGGDTIRDIKIFIPQFQSNFMDTYYYIDTYNVPEEAKKEDFNEALKKYYLDLIIPEVNLIIEKEFHRQPDCKIIIIGKSYKEVDYIKKKLSEKAKKYLFSQKTKKESFALLIEKLRNSEKGYLEIFAGRYEGFNLPNLSLLIVMRVPFLSWEWLFLLHNVKDKGILSTYNQYEATIKLKQIIGRLMRGDNEKKLYILDSRVTRFENLLKLYEQKGICRLNLRAIEYTVYDLEETEKKLSL